MNISFIEFIFLLKTSQKICIIDKGLRFNNTPMDVSYLIENQYFNFESRTVDFIEPDSQQVSNGLLDILVTREHYLNVYLK